MVMISKLDVVQMKSLYCAGNKLRCTFVQYSPVVKNILFRAYSMPIYACQLWSKYTQTSLKRLRIAYNANRIMRYIPRNVSVLAHTNLTIISGL